MRTIKKTLFLLTLILGLKSAFAQSPDWKVSSANYQFNMNITGVLVNSCVFLNNTENKIAAFAGEELRGTATFSTEYDGLALAFLTVFSNSASGEILTFKAYDSEIDQVIGLEVKAVFTENGVHGSPAMPFQFYADAPVLKGMLELVNSNLIQYSEEIPGATYTWYKDGKVLESGESNSLSVCQSGMYKVEVANGSCSTQKDSVQYTGADPVLTVKKSYDGTALSHIISVNECEESFSGYTYSLVDGDGAGDNHLFEISEDTLKLKPDSSSQSKIDYQIRILVADAYGNSFEQVVNLEYIAVGTKDALDNQISVYPNPIESRFLNIDLPDDNVKGTVLYRLLTTEGLLVRTKQYTSNILELPSSLTPGIYILAIDIDGQVVYKKLVKN
jgi:hypothetical protein